jgi:hypothetical protein
MKKNTDLCQTEDWVVGAIHMVHTPNLHVVSPTASLSQNCQSRGIFTTKARNGGQNNFEQHAS